MNKSYKIALLVTILVCVTLIGYTISKSPDKPVASATTKGPQNTASLPNATESAKPTASSSELTPKTNLAHRVRQHIGHVATAPRDPAVISSAQSSATIEPVEVPNPVKPKPPLLTLGAPSPSVEAAKPPVVDPGTEAAKSRPQPSQSSRQPVTGGTHKDLTTAPQFDAYTIRPGDTFNSIAAAYFESASNWQVIGAANPKVDPLSLRVGQVIKIPRRVQTADLDPDIPPPPKGQTVHHIRKGESLWTIAHQYYQDGQHWRIIYNANRKRLGANPDHLRAGDKLNIPPAVVVPDSESSDEP